MMKEGTKRKENLQKDPQIYNIHIMDTRSSYLKSISSVKATTGVNYRGHENESTKTKANIPIITQ